MFTTDDSLNDLVRRLPDALKPLYGFLFLKNTEIIRRMLGGRAPNEHPALSGKPEAELICTVIELALEAAENLSGEIPELNRRSLRWEALTENMAALRRAVQTEGLDDLNTTLTALSGAVRLLIRGPKDLLLGDVMGALLKQGTAGSDAAVLATAFSDLKAYLSENYAPPSMPPVTLPLPTRVARVRELTPQLRKAGKRAETAYAAVHNLLLMQIDALNAFLRIPLERVLAGQGVGADQAAFIVRQLEECRLAQSILPKTYGHLADLLTDPSGARRIEEALQGLFAAGDVPSPARDILTVLVETLAVLFHEEPGRLPEAVLRNRLIAEPGTTYSAYAALAAVRLLGKRQAQK